MKAYIFQSSKGICSPDEEAYLLILMQSICLSVVTGYKAHPTTLRISSTYRLSPVSNNLIQVFHIPSSNEFADITVEQLNNSPIWQCHAIIRSMQYLLLPCPVITQHAYHSRNLVCLQTIRFHFNSFLLKKELNLRLHYCTNHYSYICIIHSRWGQHRINDQLQDGWPYSDVCP